MKQLNTYSYASGEVSDAENLIECIEANRRGYASISIYNLGGSSIPVMKAGSTVEIGGTIYTAESDETAKFYTGTTFLDATYANVQTGTYFLALVPSSANSDETTELTLCIMSISSYEYHQDYRGWYQTNTLNRIIGGITISNSGSAITASEKWLMTHTHMSYTLEDPASPYFRLYSDGVEGVLRVNKTPIEIYSNGSTIAHETTAIDLVSSHVASCPQWLHVAIRAVTRSTSSTSSYDYLFGATGIASLIALDNDGNELDTVESKTITVTPTAKTFNLVFNGVTPGKYKIRFTPSKFTTAYYPNGYAPSTPYVTINLTITTTSTSVKVMNTYGARRGTY